MSQKIYIKCREVSTTDRSSDDTLPRDIEDIEQDDGLLSFLRSSTNGTIIGASFGIFFMLVIYFIGKYIFKTKPQTIYNKHKDTNTIKSDSGNANS